MFHHKTFAKNVAKHLQNIFANVLLPRDARSVSAVLQS